MKNKANLLLFLLPIFLLSCGSMKEQAQANRKYKDYFTAKTYTDEQIEALKNTTIVFLLRTQDAPLKEVFEKVIKETWDFSPILVDFYTNKAAYQDGKHSFFSIESRNVRVQNYSGGVQTTGGYDFPQIFLALRSPIPEMKGDKIMDETTVFYRTHLFPDKTTMDKVIKGRKVVQGLYGEDTKIRNWSPAMIKFYLIDAKMDLNASIRSSTFAGKSNTASLKKLKRDTLYVPDYVAERIDPVARREVSNEPVEPLLEDYDAPYQIVSVDQLMGKLHTDENVYVLDYGASSADKFIRILSIKDGKVYQSYKPMSYRLRSRDLANVHE